MNCFSIAGAMVLLAGLSFPLSAQGTFIPLDEPSSRATGISGDGTIVVGSYGQGGGAWRWTQAGGLERIGGKAPFITEVRISRDGRTIVYADSDQAGLISAAIWQGGQNWRRLGSIPAGVPGGNDEKELSTAYGVSGDGLVIVGLAWIANSSATAFRWDAEKGMVDLGRLRTGSARANMVSTDGHVIAGWESLSDVGAYAQSRVGVMWWDGLERLLHPFSWVGEVMNGSDNGTVLVGRGAPSDTAFGHAFRWVSYGDGRFDDLGIADLKGTLISQGNPDVSTALGVNQDGSVVIGTSGVAPPAAMIWTPDSQMMYLGTFLRNRGITGFDRWILLECTAMSEDAKTIVGSGFDPQGTQRAFVVQLTEPPTTSQGVAIPTSDALLRQRPNRSPR